MEGVEKKENLMKFRYEKREKKKKHNESLPYIIYVYTHGACQMK